MSATHESDAPEFGMRHVTVVPTNLRKGVATPAGDQRAERADDSDAE